MAGTWNNGNSFSAGWGASYLLPAFYWQPVKTPPFYWETVGSPGPPQGFILPWWYERDKTKWPYQPVPWEPKVLGAFSSRRVTMWSKNQNEYSNLVNYPPFGTIKVKTPTQPTRPAGQSPNALTPIRVHMLPDTWLDVTPHPSLWAKGTLEVALREMSRKRPIRLQTETGSITIKSMRSASWYQHRNRLREEREEMKRVQEEENKLVNRGSARYG
jgi:hypothetical protein